MQTGQPPAARVENVRETHFGVTVDDPYRWMEQQQSEETQAWMRAQADYAREYLESLPERDVLLARISELSDATPALYGLQLRGTRVFYLRRDPGENLGKLVTRPLDGGAERVLLDPNTLSGEVHSAIDYYEASWDGRYVAYGISQGGSEESELHVLDAETGQPLDIAIPRAIYGAVVWLADSQVFLFNRSPLAAEDGGEANRYTSSRMYLHRLGTPVEQDVAVFGIGVHPGVTLEPVDIPSLRVTPESVWMVGVVQHGDQNERTIYVAPLADLEHPSAARWTKVADVEDGVISVDLDGAMLYLLSHAGAPRYQVLATPLGQPDIASARVIVPESRAVIEEIAAAGKTLLVVDLDGGVNRLRKVRLAEGTAGAPEPIALPVDGSLTALATSPSSSEALVQLTSWTVSPRIYRLDIRLGQLDDTGWQPPSQVDFSGVEVREVFAPAPDGTRIPVSILTPKGIALDGSRPTLLMGYGSYGISLTPGFRPTWLAWLERGGVLAVAHIRGGGEYGDEWHKAGQKLNKQNTIDDFIAAAEYLVREGYTRPELLAGEGGSAGGIPSGGALVKRPDLWAVMVMNVPVTDALRSEFTENGVPNILEFGSVTTEEGFRALQIIDSYRKVRDGVAYPAVLLTTGANDPRVEPWMAMKMAARLQAATSSGRPVLLRVEYQGGHGMGSTKQQVNAETADTWAFLLRQFGR